MDFTEQSLVEKIKEFKPLTVELKNQKIQEFPIIALPYLHSVFTSVNINDNPNIALYKNYVVSYTEEDISGAEITNNYLVSLIAYEDPDANNAITFKVICSDKFLVLHPNEKRGVSADEKLDKSLSDLIKKLSTKIEDKYDLPKNFISKNIGIFASKNCKRSDKSFLLKKQCIHTDVVLKYLSTLSESDIFKLITDLTTQLKSYKIKKDIDTSTHLLSLWWNTGIGNPFLLYGPTGTGKTHSIRSFCRDIYEKAAAELANSKKVDINTLSIKEVIEYSNFLYIEVPCSSSTEQDIIYGQYLPTKEANLAWNDGLISKAFRAAANGKKVIVCLDEIGRLPLNTQALFINIINPDNGYYKIVSTRVLNVTEENLSEVEEIICPVENLLFVATTNIGADYPNTDMSDKALASRFIQIPYNNLTSKTLIEYIAKAKNIDFDDYTKHVIKFEDAIRKLKESDTFKGIDIPSIRWYLMLFNYIQSVLRSKTVSKETINNNKILTQALDIMKFTIISKDPATGLPERESTEAVTTLLKELFK